MVNLCRHLSVFETQIRALPICQRVAQTRVQLRFESRHSDFFRCAHVQTGMQHAARIVGHQNLHLSLRECLDVEIFRSVLLVFALRGRAGFFIPFVHEHALLLQTVTSPRDRLLRGRADEIARRFFVAGAEDNRGVRSRCDVFLETAADLHELRQTLHGKQKCGFRSTGGLQYLGEVSVPERGEFVEHDAEQRPLDPVALLFAFVTLADDELQVLQKHLAERADRFGVLVHVERDEENQFLLDDVVDRKQVRRRVR